MITRRLFLTTSAAAGAAASLTVAGALAPAAAKAPVAGAQVAAVHRLKIGTIEVTAIGDGHLQLGPELFAAATPDRLKALTEAAFLPEGAAATAVNTYVVNTGDRLVLVDTGAAAWAPSTGKLMANLAAAGIQPGDIDTIVLTHLHPDHALGLIDAKGAAVFPNAEIVVRDTEKAFWTDAAREAQAPDGMKPLFAGARNAIAPYAKRTRLLAKSGEEVMPGVTSLDLPGHTVGHTGYRISSGDAQLLIWGDVVHVGAWQFAEPAWAIAFDTDQAQAIETRRKVLDEVATDRVMVAGMHLAFPGFGHVAKDGSAYRFVPAPWSYEL